MATRHQRAAKAAGKTGDELGRLFAQMGTSQHPRGAVLSAYRTARKALKGNFSSLATVEDALGTLRLAVERANEILLRDATEIGLKQAETELAIYGLELMGGVGAQTRQEALRSIIATLEAQITQVRALALTGADEALVIGDASRVGLLSPAPVSAEASRWLALVAEQSHEEIIQDSIAQAGAGDEYMRQAIAAIDERTTDCCLRVHGQVVSLDGEFTLTGTPRFADRLHAPPFHWYCRTGIALVRRIDADDEWSQEMRDAARAELTAREETGQRVEIHPAHARSRR